MPSWMWLPLCIQQWHSSLQICNSALVNCSHFATVSNWHNSVNLNISRILHVNKQGIGIFSQLTECARAWYCFCAAISLSISSLGICNSISRPNTIRCLSCVNYWRSFLQKIVSNSGLIPSEIQILRSEIKWCLAEMHENTAVNWASSNHNNLKDDKF